MADRAAIIIAVMKPSDRITGRPRRLIAAIAACLAAHAATADDLACRVTTEADPRLEELLAADPNDPRIDITSDQGELGRAGDASLSGNVRIRMGQRPLTADAAEIDAEARSVRLSGNVEYLDPLLHVRGRGGEYSDGAGSFGCIPMAPKIAAEVIAELSRALVLHLLQTAVADQFAALS